MLAVLLWVSACERAEQPATTASAIDPVSFAINAERILNADSETANWLTHGRTYDEQRFSPLDAINDSNVGELGLAWYYDYPVKRGMEATPIVVDGIMFTTSAWSMVFSHDARTGELLWSHDPKVPKEWAVKLCCDVVNRGVAIWEGRIYSGTIDGRLLALDAATGDLLWEVQTTDIDKPYSITGAPRIIDGKIIIGNGGAEYGVRGYVSAYDVDDGSLVWRFHTVPGDPEKPFESAAMEMAAKTWNGEWWKLGGGGTVWDSMAYDPELDLLYIGTGNGSPWNQQIRSPGGGDNLFLSSIVALRPDTGEYVWHYQTTPGESWDYTAAQHMILADIDIDGTPRKVIMQAPKNGFFYVLDRVSGEFISGQAFVPMTWATGIDPETGRPMETANARFTDEPAFALPGPPGGHNWMPMSYSPLTGLVYIPAQQIPFVFGHDGDYAAKQGLWNTGIAAVYAGIPDDPDQQAAVLSMVKGEIIAWDPRTQKDIWRIQHDQTSNGGLLSTAGNLLFQGDAKGEFAAYTADSGDKLWSTDVQTGVVAAPVTFEVDGDQYVSIVVGWGGSIALFAGKALKDSAYGNKSRLLTFKLGGTETLPASEQQRVVLDPPVSTADAQTIALGKISYANRCMVCHGDGAVSGGVIPDLRYLPAAKHDIWDAIVRDGALASLGMAGFGDALSKEQTDAVHAYVIERANFALKKSN